MRRSFWACFPAILRLTRRSIICSKAIDVAEDFLPETISSIIDTMHEFYPYLDKNKQTITDVVLQEQKLFNKTFAKGYELYKKSLSNVDKIDAETIFK